MAPNILTPEARQENVKALALAGGHYARTGR